MENTTPIKKVNFRDGDVYYIYDKRINKCVKDGCQGTVKYGLNLQVNMPNGDTLNTYECNKCHMKYTAYPNYVRLKETRQLIILNHDEIKAKDKKRWIDAKKQLKKQNQFKKSKKTNKDKVTIIGGYKKRYISVYDKDKRIAATD
jgi:sorbitol-specific phosphotransferase system component IIBC